MKTTSTFISLLGLAGILLFTSCRPAQMNDHIVAFSCEPASYWMNYANLSPTGPDEQGSFAFYLTGPSLLFSETDKKDFMYLYLPEDGNTIALRINNGILYANDIARTLVLSTNNLETINTWLERADDAALKNLRFISIEDEDAARNETVRKILKVNPHAAVWPNGGDDLPTVSPGSSPLFLAIDSSETNSMYSPLELESMDLSETRMLITCDIDDAAVEILRQKKMPKLHKIICCDTASETLLAAFPHVKAVVMMEADEAPDLSLMNDLEALHILSDIPINFGELPHPKKLKAVTIGISANTAGLEKLTNLEYFYPGDIELTDETLTALLAAHPDLAFLELLQADLQSLEPLRKADKLEAVSFGKFLTENHVDFSPLSNLPNLRYVGLTEGARTPEVAAAIREACPQVVIYQHDRFCLGSGWLVLLLPALLLLLLVKRFLSKAQKGV